MRLLLLVKSHVSGQVRSSTSQSTRLHKMTVARPYRVSINAPRCYLRSTSPLYRFVYPKHQCFTGIERFEHDPWQNHAHLKLRPLRPAQYIVIACVVARLRPAQCPQQPTDRPFSCAKQPSNPHFRRPLPRADPQNACANRSITVIINVGRLSIFYLSGKSGLKAYSATPFFHPMPKA